MTLPKDLQQIKDHILGVEQETCDFEDFLCKRRCVTDHKKKKSIMELIMEYESEFRGGD